LDYSVRRSLDWKKWKKKADGHWRRRRERNPNPKPKGEEREEREERERCYRYCRRVRSP